MKEDGFIWNPGYALARKGSVWMMKVYSSSDGKDAVRYIRLSELEQPIRQMFTSWLARRTTSIVVVDELEVGDAVEYADYRRFVHEAVEAD